MMGKQIIIDIVVVIVLPALLIFGYYEFKSEDGALLSLASPTIATQEGHSGPPLGEKTANALALLRSIPTELSQSLFSDPAYLMLKDYRVSIPSVTLGRSNPFTPPPALEVLSRFSRTADGVPVREVTPTAPATSAKVDTLKKTAAQ
jgi:hypothetical protein